jgi:hypothetical protein
MKNINQKQKPKLALEIPSTVGDINQLEFFDIEEKERKVYEKFLVAKNMSTIREVPYEPVKVFTLDRSMVRERKREDYLLVGFDTEYQPMQEVFTNKDVKDKIARYEVLSYQFFAIASDGSTWSGIAIPDAGCRLTFAQFMIYVLAAGAHRGHVISQHIVLVGHYNRADVPAFDDRDQVYEHVRNVRNSLVTQGVPITLEVSFSEDKTDTMDLKVYLRDTMLLAPAGKQSLESLGGLVGKEKMTLSDKAADELFLKKRMKFVRDNKWPLFRQYAILDAEISALYFKEVTRIYQRATGRKFVPTVLSSIGMELLQAEWKARVPSVETTEMVGQELHSEEVWNDKTAQFNTKKFKPYIEQIHWHIDFATECYHGGRSEQLWFGPSFEDDWSDYDLTSAYPIAMATIGKPDWGSIFPTTDLSTFSMDAFGFACVDFRFPEGTRYPTLPIRSPHGIIFPLAGRSYCSTPEIHLALDLGCEMQVRHGVVIPQDLNSKVFFPFIKDSIRRRREAKESGSDVGEKFWKEVSNSCYGKTAQGLREKRVFGLRTKRNERIGPSAISNPFYAAYITSFVRAAIGELMNSLPTNRMVFSVTTDGFTTNATAAEMEDAKTGPIMKLYRETVLALTGKDEAVSEKHAVKQLLGWRMRGQATLKPGDATDDKRIVLAKAGVRPPMEYKTPEEQNDYMVDLFFRRTPEMRSDIEVFTTMSDMIMHGADLVRKMTSKRLSMEYDFKRCPSAVGLAEVTLAKSGKIYEHIAFNTKPWRDVTEFKMVRAMWEDYRRGEKVCMTTIKHFSDFAEFFEMMKSLPDGSQKYLRRKDKTGLQRLRRDICRAYKHGEAGFPKEPQLSARELAELLNSTSMQSHGIKTEIEDVENGKRTAFKPHTSPPTKEVLRVLRELKGTFPGLDDAALVGAISPDQVMLSAALRTECQFIDQLVAPSHDDGP